MTKIKDIAAILEQAAPLRIQAPFDNSGLIVGHPDDEVDSAMIAVDATEEVMDEAERCGAKLVITHHPIIFHPLKRLTGCGYVQRIVERAIRGGIALYACHTNLDYAREGMSFRAAQLLGIENPAILEPITGAISGAISGAECEAGAGVVGELPEAMHVYDFMALLKERFALKVIRHSDITGEKVRRVALCTGSGASLIDAAAAAGADIYIAADFKYNDFTDADGRLVVVDIGHFESEYLAIDLIYDIIRKKMPTFALRKSANSRNPINYII